MIAVILFSAGYGVVGVVREWIAGLKPAVQEPFWRTVALGLGLVIGLTSMDKAIPVLANSGVLWVVRQTALSEVEADMAIGLPGVIALLSIAGVLFVGFFGRACPTGKRELWGRLGGVLSVYGLGWFGLCAISFGSLEGLQEIKGKLTQYVLGGGWSLSTIWGVISARSSATGGSEPNPLLEKLVSFVPYVFVIGLIVLLSAGLEALQPAWFGKLDEWFSLSGDATLYATTIGILIRVAGFASYRFDLNDFSMHNYYRNRLVRAYLGASHNTRKPQPFTGFDPTELDLWVSDLTREPQTNFEAKKGRAVRIDRAGLSDGKKDYPEGTAEPSSDKEERASGHEGPYHLINTTLNLASGKDLA